MTDIVDRLHDLVAQATTERSHYYVGKCARAAISEIERLRSVLADIAVHPGPNADEGAHWRSDAARAAIRKQEGI